MTEPMETARPAVLIVDDEEDIRYSFMDRFEDLYRVFAARDGAQALEILRREPDLSAVVTDVRMPVMSGLELIRNGRAINPDVGFIVVSGHAEATDVIQALRAGARNFLRKPYSLDELQEALATEVRSFHAIRQSRSLRDRVRDAERLIVGIDSMQLRVPNDLTWVNPLAFRMASTLANIPICGEDGRLNVALGLVEMLINAIEHGNLGITGPEKSLLKQRGEAAYLAELEKRARLEPYRSRFIHVTFRLDSEQATFDIEDEGDGFDIGSIPNPEDPGQLFALHGRGILLTRAYFDDVIYNDKGNAVRLMKRRQPAPA